MKNQSLLRALCLPILVVISLFANAQIQTARHIAINNYVKGFYEYLPEGYNPSSSETYPLLIFMHGAGERGDGSPSQLPRITNNGVAKMIKNGTFPKSFTVNGKTHKFIVISPQFVDVPPYPGGRYVNDVIDYAVANYKVNVNRIYLTGLSMGGGMIFLYLENNQTYANRIAAMVPICQAYGYNANTAQLIANAGINTWMTHNSGDPTVNVSSTINYTSAINSYKPGLAKSTIWQSNSHDAWTKTYDVNYRENGLNSFEWMLQYERGSSTSPTPPTNSSPVVNAGSDKSITLPMNSVTLNGSASDPDGSISSYTWAKVSGPSTFTLSSTTTSSPTVNNLVQGTYVFRLTVKDNLGATAYDDVNVVVNPVVTQPTPTNGQRILIDFGSTPTSTDQWGKTWNTVANVQKGIKLTNAKTISNTNTSIGLEVINRIDGTFGTSGPGVNTGNTVGIVGEYPASTTTDFSFAHSSTTSGKWRIYGLDATKEYTIKFWGTKSHSANYTIQIKRADESNWQEYNASNNNNYNNAAVFTFSGKTEMSFDIRTKSGTAGFGYINVIDINTGTTSTTPTPTPTPTPDTTTTGVLSVYPNPVTDNFILQINNSFVGKTLIQVVDARTGAIRKEVNSTKSSTGPAQIYLSIGDIPNGVYIVRVWLGYTAHKIQISKQ